MKLISIVVPVYNEEVNIRHFYEAIRTVMEPLPYAFELIFVDDGSTDGWTPKVARELERCYPNVRTYSRAGQYDPSDWASTPWSQFTTARRRVDAGLRRGVSRGHAPAHRRKPEKLRAGAQEMRIETAFVSPAVF